jgi:uncharacterized protein
MIVDTNVHLGRWPFRHSPWDSTASIVAKLKALHVVQAWCGSCEAPFDKDLAGVNARLARACRDVQEVPLLPFGAVNPHFPDWRDDLRRCHESHGMRGVRLYPNYHGYTLADPPLSELLEQAAARQLLVQLVVQMEDVRTQHPKMQVPPVDITPLPSLVAKIPSLRLQVLNAPGTIPEPILVPLARSGRVFFDIAMVEGLGGVGRFVESAGAAAVLFGSHFPLFYPESAVLKIREADLADGDAGAIQAGNARRILG